jgi:hypothetical protein
MKRLFVVIVALACLGAAHAQSTGSTGAAPAACYVQVTGSGKPLAIVARDGKQCQAGAPIRFDLYRANGWIKEQVCDFSRPMQTYREDPHEETSLITYCTFSGQIRDPEAKFMDSQSLIFAKVVNGKFLPLDSQSKL